MKGTDERCLFLLGDTREQMRRLPPGEIACCVTSPPYFGLRDYGVEGQIGLEPTPEAFVTALVEVFREVRRVLRDDGTVWLNLGDSYAGGGRTYRAPAGKDSKGGPEGIKPKDLLGIPWRVAFALQADGWYLRQDIIWAKPNPMPESVTDRCTKAHEYVFLLAKSPVYYFDHAAIKEPCSTADPSSPSYRKNGKSDSRKKHAIYCSACDGSGDETDENGDDCQVCGGTGRSNVGMAKIAVKNEGFWKPPEEGRNKRRVWTVPTKPYKGAHFATFPPDLIEPCILAGSRPGDVVLDPFGGAGTTALVSLQHGRDSVYIDLNPEYERVARARLAEAFSDAS